MRRPAAIAIAVLVAVAVCVGGYWVVTTPRAEDQSWKRLGGTVEVADDERTVTLTYAGGSCDDHADLDVDESDDEVVLTLSITLRRVSSCDDMASFRTITTRLDDPLGERLLVDGFGRD